MGYFLEGFYSALKMIASLDRQMLSIAFVSLKVSVLSTMLATLVGLPIGCYVGIRNFRGRKALVSALNTLMSVPTVVIGLSVYFLLSRRGPLGSLGLLYTPWAMVLGQAILAFPIVASLSLSAVINLDKRVEKTALSLGADNIQTVFFIFSEGRFAIISAVIAAFGRVFGEVGVSMMLGGNISGLTRNIPTAIALETGKGEFTLAIALGMILLSVALLVNILAGYFQHKK